MNSVNIVKGRTSFEAKIEASEKISDPFFGHNVLLGRYVKVDSNKKQDNPKLLKIRML